MAVSLQVKGAIGTVSVGQQDRQRDQARQRREEQEQRDRQQRDEQERRDEQNENEPGDDLAAMARSEAETDRDHDGAIDAIDEMDSEVRRAEERAAAAVDAIDELGDAQPLPEQHVDLELHRRARRRRDEDDGQLGDLDQGEPVDELGLSPGYQRVAAHLRRQPARRPAKRGAAPALKSSTSSRPPRLKIVS